MSADNYYYVFKRDGKYVVQCRFMSSDYDEHTPKTGGVEFDTFAEADAYAHEEYSEYGVYYGFSVTKALDALGVKTVFDIGEGKKVWGPERMRHDPERTR